MTLGRYISGHSWLHQLDPRTKILCGLILTLLVFKNSSPILLGGIVLSLLLLPGLTKLPYAITIKGQKALLPLLGVVFFLNAGLTPGQPIQAFGYTLPWMTAEGMMRGSSLALRLNAMVLLFAWLTITTSSTELSDSLEYLLRPLNKRHIPTHHLILGLAVALRFVPIIFTETERLYQAQLSRGAQFSGLRRITRFIPILIPLFVATLTRAERLTQTLESRGYQHHQTRSHYHALAFKRRDLFAFIMVGGFATYMFLNL